MTGSLWLVIISIHLIAAFCEMVCIDNTVELYGSKKVILLAMVWSVPFVGLGLLARRYYKSYGLGFPDGLKDRSRWLSPERRVKYAQRKK